MARKRCYGVAFLLLLWCGCDSGGAEPVGRGRWGGGDTLFLEGFESGGLSVWDDGVDPERHRVVSGPGRVRTGAYALEITYPAGADGGWLTRFLPPGHDSLHVSLYVRFEPGWLGSTKLVALYGSPRDDPWSAFGRAGNCPTGTDFFATMVVTESGTGDPGRARFYTYYPGMRREPDGRTCWGRFGDDNAQYYPGGHLRPGEWHHIEFRVRLNAPGVRDGVQEYRVDGELVGIWSGLSLRTTSALQLNALQLTASAAGVGVPRRLYIDDIVVTTGAGAASLASGSPPRAAR